MPRILAQAKARTTNWRSALAGVALCVVFGLLLLSLGGWPVFLSYDLVFLLSKPPPPEDAVIIYLDDQSFKELGQTSTPNWDRNLHARLLDRLTEDECKLDGALRKSTWWRPDLVESLGG